MGKYLFKNCTRFCNGYLSTKNLLPCKECGDKPVVEFDDQGIKAPYFIVHIYCDVYGKHLITAEGWSLRLAKKKAFRLWNKENGERNDILGQVFKKIQD